MAPRFPRLDPEVAPAGDWREVPLTDFEAILLEESYGHMLRRLQDWRRGAVCSGHVWMRIEQGPWVCEHCTAQRWTPPGSETLKFGYGPHKVVIPPEMADRFVEEFKRRWIGEGHGTNEG
jgi:hypothetical protein